MMLGMSLSSFTTVHVVISLIGIASGLVVLYAMLNSADRMFWTAVFLAAFLDVTRFHPLMAAPGRHAPT